MKYFQKMASNNGYLTEELAWVTPKFHGLIIGTKTGIRSVSGAEVIINRNGSQKCIIKGYGYQSTENDSRQNQ